LCFVSFKPAIENIIKFKNGNNARNFFLRLCKHFSDKNFLAELKNKKINKLPAKTCGVNRFKKKNRQILSQKGRPILKLKYLPQKHLKRRAF
jgi:hypothetical protein